MRLVPIKQAEHELLKFVKRQQLGYWQLATFKKDRQVTLKITADKFTITENGYQKTAWNTPDALLCRKQLKVVFKREFPRSHQIYLQAKETLR